MEKLETTIIGEQQVEIGVLKKEIFKYQELIRVLCTNIQNLDKLSKDELHKMSCST